MTHISRGSPSGSYNWQVHKWISDSTSEHSTNSFDNETKKENEEKKRLAQIFPNSAHIFPNPAKLLPKIYG